MGVWSNFRFWSVKNIILFPFKIDFSQFFFIDSIFESSLDPILYKQSISSWGNQELKLFNSFISFKERIGVEIRIALFFVGVLFSKLSSLPRYLYKLITEFSLKESIGGLVTWANCCLKKS